MRKPRFNRRAEFVCVRPFRLTRHDVVNPGDPIVGYRLHRLRSLYERGRIGMVGNAWTDEMLKHGAAGRNPNRAIIPASERRKPQILSGYTPEQYAQLPTEQRAMIEKMHAPDLSKITNAVPEHIEPEKKRTKKEQKALEDAHKRHMQEREAAAKAKRQAQKDEAEQEEREAEAAAELLEKSEAEAAAALTEESEETDITALGGGWYELLYQNATYKVKGKANVEAKLKELQGDNG